MSRLLMVFAMFAAFSAMLSFGATFATHVEPVLIQGNPSCADLGLGQFEFKIDSAPFTGTHDIDGVNSVTVTTSDNVYFDWTSTLSIDGVIVKGGPNANEFAYTPESFGDTGLHSPINPNTGMPFGISHISFCYDYEVVVKKTAETSFTRTFHWDIDKSVTPDTWDLFTGDSGTSKYTVNVSKTGFTDSDHAVNGTIWIHNPAPVSATVTGVTDSITGGINATVDCGVSFPHVLGPGQDLHCTYSSDLPDGTDRKNTASVTTTGQVGGGEATADVVFGDPTTVVNDTISVTDTFAGNLGSFSSSGSTSYTRTFFCDGDEGIQNNTATIVETGQQDSASVTVNCHALEVRKDANTSLTRTWVWTVDKSADQTDLLLSEGQLFTVNYEVEVSTTGTTDSDWAVNGNIWIQNQNPSTAAILTAVSDVVSPNIVAAVNCPSLLVPAGGSLHCTYSASLPDASTRLNTATANLQNHSYDHLGGATPSGTTEFSGSANVSFSSAAINEIDECVNVSDTNVGSLGTVCANQAPMSFAYEKFVGPFTAPDECGDRFVRNTASFVTNDTGTTGSDDWAVHVFVACDFGCTLTPGYWKTHSREGPAPYDDTWALLPNGASTSFFLSGQTYYQVLWTSPSGGNVYYILAHAYIAAVLNGLNGASSTPQIDAALDWAENFFNTYLPTSSLSRSARNQAISTATVLDNYNNGLIGPGHCSE